MRAAGHGRFLLLWLICWCAPLCQAGSPGGGGVLPLTRQQLVGTWRLVSIDYATPRGPMPDPFYQTGSTGILIYDSTGWMSVQIAAPHRPRWEIPQSRSSSAASAQKVPSKAEAFDTYYAYFGTWDFDEATAVLTHHVKASLIPAETDLNYAQTATLEGARLVFTGRGGMPGEKTIRRKVWERITADAE